MSDQTDLTKRLASGELDDTLTQLYGPFNLEYARARCHKVINGYKQTFGSLPEALFSAPGRTELGGNHTDHQHGQVLAASVNLDTLAAVGKNESGVIRVQSQKYPLNIVDLSELSPRQNEAGDSTAIIRGIAAQFSSIGCSFDGVGFNAYTVTNVPSGSGLSSSAAFEVLIAVIINELFLNGKCSPVELAKMGQYAENAFFGKPCGLMDQTASSVGGVVSIDFADAECPAVEQISLDLEAAGHALCILDSGAGHANLTAEYASITDELKAVSRYFGREFLHDVPEESFMAALPQMRKFTGDRAIMRSLHFYSENKRAAKQAAALKSGDFNGFLKLVRESGFSSALFLQNVIPTGQTVKQELMLTIALSQRLLGEHGAVRVHGGGFGGTAQAFVPLNMLDDFKARVEAVLGIGSCHVLSIRPIGGIRIV